MIIEQIGKPILYTVWATKAKPLNRYALRPGRIFGNPRSDNRYRVLDVYGDWIIYKDVKKDRVVKRLYDELLEEWGDADVREITDFEKLIEDIKHQLTPFLGGFLAGLLIKWLN